MSDMYESAINGLVLLGRTRCEAIAEVREAEEKKQREAEMDWWNADGLRWFASKNSSARAGQEKE